MATMQHKNMKVKSEMVVFINLKIYFL